MRNRLIALLFLSVCAVFFLSSPHAESNKRRILLSNEPESVTASAFAISAPVRSIAMPPAPAKPRDFKSIPLKEINETESEDLGLLQSGLPHDSDRSLALFTDTSMPVPTISFDGVSNIDNANHYDLFFIP